MHTQRNRACLHNSYGLDSIWPRFGHGGGAAFQMAKVLIVEDDDFIARELQVWLSREMHTVDISSTADDGLYRLKHFVYDIAIIDWNLPDLEGVEVCSRVRTLKPELPLLMLTSRGTVSDKVEGLDSGAFDYLVKPCALAEVSARIRSLMRRTTPAAPQGDAAFADLELNAISLVAYCSSKELKLSASEFDILQVLLRSNDKHLNYRDLAKAIGQADDSGLRDRMKHLMQGLRERLKEAGSRVSIEYSRGQGYILVELSRK